MLSSSFSSIASLKNRHDFDVLMGEVVISSLDEVTLCNLMIRLREVEMSDDHFRHFQGIFEEAFFGKPRPKILTYARH